MYAKIEAGWKLCIPSVEDASALLGEELVAPRFDGQKVIVVTQSGRSIGGPVEDYAPEWLKPSGGVASTQNH